MGEKRSHQAGKGWPGEDGGERTALSGQFDFRACVVSLGFQKVRCSPRLLFRELSQEVNGFLDVLVQTDLLVNDFALRVQDCDDVRVRELAVRAFLEFQSEQRGKLQYVVWFAAQQRPVFNR